MADSIPPELQSDRMIISPVPDSSITNESTTHAHPDMPHLEPFDRSPRQTGNSLDFSEFSDALSEISNENLLLDDNILISPALNAELSNHNITISPTLNAELSNINPTQLHVSDIKLEPDLPDLPNVSTEESDRITISLLPKNIPDVNEKPEFESDPKSKLTPKNLKRYHIHTRILQDILDTADAKNNSPPPAKQFKHSKPPKSKRNRPTETKYPHYRYPRNNRVSPQNTRPSNRFSAPPSYSSTHPQSFNNSTTFSRTFVPPFAPPLPRRPMVPLPVLERLNHVSQLFRESRDSLAHFAYHFDQLKAILRNN